MNFSNLVQFPHLTTDVIQVLYDSGFSTNKLYTIQKMPEKNLYVRMRLLIAIIICIKLIYSLPLEHHLRFYIHKKELCHNSTFEVFLFLMN